VVEVDRFLGDYRAADGSVLHIRRDGPGLALESPGSGHAPSHRRPLFPVSGAEALFVTRDGTADDLNLLVFEPVDPERGQCPAFGWGSQSFTRVGVTRPAPGHAPPEWSAYPGHYRSEDPWVGSHRIDLREGQLWLDGAIPLEPTGDGRFWWRNEPTSPEWVSFADVVSGRAMTITLSGEHLVRQSESSDPGFNRR
jgi:hypothetical protein